MKALRRGGLLILTLALALVPGATVPLGCASRGGDDCTDAACSSGVYVTIPLELVPDVPGVLRSRACVDGRCGRWEVADRHSNVGWGDFEGDLALEQSYRVTIEVMNRRDELLLRAERTVEPELLAPNGVECGPVCHTASFEVETTDIVDTRT